MYSPKIKDHHVKALYRLKQILRRPMTHLVEDAIEQYIKQLSNELIKEMETKENEKEFLF